MQLLKSIDVKHQFTDAEKLELLRQISEVNDVIIEKNLELEGLKESVKVLKEAIDSQYSDIQSIIAKYKQGFEVKMYQCAVKYHDNEAIFADSETGEIVEKRPMTEAEQLALTEHRTDAESIIREASENEI